MRALTPKMHQQLLEFHRLPGELGLLGPAEFGGNLWWKNRDRMLDGLVTRGLLKDDGSFVLTEAGTALVVEHLRKKDVALQTVLHGR